MKVNLTPTYDHQVSGLVVNKSEDDLNKSVIILWGDNLKDGTYKYVDTETKKIIFHPEKSRYTEKDAARYSLYTDSNEVASELKQIRVGDQVKLEGQILGKDASDQTSNADFCKALYVKSVQILKQGNLMSRFLFTLSFWMLCVWIVSNIILFVYASSIMAKNQT